YYATNTETLEISKDWITNIICTTSNEHDLFTVFNAILISKDLCHLVINNKQVLEKMKPIINKYKPLYKYLFSYVWLCMYLEECIFKTKTTKNSRYVFDIE